jgi:hypothetical protein
MLQNEYIVRLSLNYFVSQFFQQLSIIWFFYRILIMNRNTFSTVKSSAAEQEPGPQGAASFWWSQNRKAMRLRLRPPPPPQP